MYGVSKPWNSVLIEFYILTILYKEILQIIDTLNFIIIHVIMYKIPLLSQFITFKTKHYLNNLKLQYYSLSNSTTRVKYFLHSVFSFAGKNSILSIIYYLCPIFSQSFKDLYNDLNFTLLHKIFSSFFISILNLYCQIPPSFLP